jgi:hypothetical protein
MSILSSFRSILSSYGHFQIDTVILSSCGQDAQITSCHSYVRAWQILIDTSQDAVGLTELGFNMRRMT